MIAPVRWAGDRLLLLDQTRLPREELTREFARWEDVAEAIRTLVVRGAPAIGVTAAFGVALAARQSRATTFDSLLADIETAIKGLAATRPTAVNLFWALDRMRSTLLAGRAMSVDAIRSRLLAEAQAILDEDVAANRAMGDHGATLVPSGARILTHCNAGALATAGYGTALGVVRSAHAQGKVALVWVDETRPVMQGSRLTAWECVRDGIPHRLVADVVAASLMGRGQVDLVVTGADRIAANGDTANKIGTYALAVLAHHHHVPFYVAAPFSTIDPTLASGAEIPIEERDPAEVRRVGATVTAPEASPVFNPAFDVTPSELIAAIITERGVFRAPYSFRG
ncbi:MAG: S-methyl-5-thioribose-1-phosphate isomerase [Candidatus Rokubacteria bacterium 13_1_20CM_4_68_9]|nr:MAG: S-methyl-5-thioribose-1-phosphate isomerase [Candidatus Rokubacteria bacterium 13_2_20CM_69_10]OLC59563.1 MAG: S-methyl-5-thioribose-1-phosphate isomerase [Candidatus Rokubacteria bacterium 13_1_40CM_4_67_11]OLD31013.1 MAG: S-methyl-5-thioribose-1-phosphate isomerase [Candidatus Rokubacteria bacterium 13_1_40CM_2_68_13]OLD98168.1 MAG: S-methyl-5-thioribose-1-phosphate isomerase [Candidatus Rokubacteria bacterium 13_1_20CM_4_68_9]